MAEQRDNGRAPAFAYEYRDTGDAVVGYYGVTKRELFSALAMQGLLSLPERAVELRETASDAVAHADALLWALEQDR